MPVAQTPVEKMTMLRSVLVCGVPQGLYLLEKEDHSRYPSEATIREF